MEPNKSQPDCLVEPFTHLSLFSHKKCPSLGETRRKLLELVNVFAKYNADNMFFFYITKKIPAIMYDRLSLFLLQIYKTVY